MSPDLPPLPSTGFDLPSISRRSLMKTAGLGASALAFPGLLSACSSDDDAGTPEAPAGIQDVEQVQLAPDSTGVVYPDGYVGPRARQTKKFADGAKTFKVVVQQDAQYVGDWNKNYMTDWLEERTGMKVEYQAVLIRGADGSVDLTKINAMLASGDLPDAFLGIPFSNDQISLYGQQGVFVALGDYIETYAPEMRAAMKDYPGWRALTTATDGKTYQYSGINDCFHCRVSPGRALVNQKYLDAVGAKLPTTTDELRTVLQTMKDNDPSPDKNIIPFAANINNQVDTFIMNAFLYNPGGDQNGGWLRLLDGKVDLVANKDEWREGLRFLNQLYKDGTLPRETFTMPDEAFLRAGNQGRLGFVRAYYWGSFVDISYEKDALWKDYVSVPPLKGPKDVQYSRWDHYGYSGGTGLVVTSKCSNPELMVQWADAQMELEAVMVGYGGEQKKNWDWAAEGEKGINSEQAVFRLKTFPPPAGECWAQYSTMYRSSGFRLGQFIDPKAPDFEKALYEASTSYEPFKEPEEFQVPPLIFGDDAAAQKADTAVSIFNHVRQSMAQFAIGEQDIEDDGAWSAYTKKFDDMNVSQYLELYQAAYDARPK